MYKYNLNNSSPLSMSCQNRISQLKAIVAYNILANNINDIRHVTDWALILGYSTKTLERIIKEHFKITAKQKLRSTRFELIKSFLKEDPLITSYQLALKVGLKNEQQVFHFLSRNYETSFSELKYKIFTENTSSIVLSHK